MMTENPIAIFQNVMLSLQKNYGKEHLAMYRENISSLETLVKNHPRSIDFKIALIRYYVAFGQNELAFSLINSIDENTQHRDILQCKAWSYYFEGNERKSSDMWRFITQVLFSNSILLEPSTLQFKKDTKKRLLSEGMIMHFACCYNEVDQLPFFLDHYRKLGVDVFFIVDNNSNDGSFEYLCKQDDVCVFTTTASYKGAGFGMAWINYLIFKYGKNNWIVHTDIDELLIYKDFETSSLLSLTTSMDNNNEKIMQGFMLDMYPNDLNNLAIDPNIPILEQHNCFYNNYLFLGNIYPPYCAVRGGIFSVLLNGLYTVLNKTPLFKGGHGVHLVSSSHVITPPNPLRLSSKTCVLMHFKLSENLINKAACEITRQQHAANSALYKGYYELMQKHDMRIDDKSYPFGTQYNNSKQLVDLGLIN